MKSKERRACSSPRRAFGGIGLRSRWSAFHGCGLGAACLLVLGLVGCTTFGFDVRSFPLPVMVSPLLRVGDAPGTTFTGPTIASVKGEKSTSSASAASSYQTVHGGSVYQVTESYYGQEWSDTIARSLVDACGGRYDVIVVVDDLKANDLTHMSLFGYVVMRWNVDGKVYDLTALRFEGGQP